MTFTTYTACQFELGKIKVKTITVFPANMTKHVRILPLLSENGRKPTAATLGLGCKKWYVWHLKKKKRKQGVVTWCVWGLGQSGNVYSRAWGYPSQERGKFRWNLKNINSSTVESRRIIAGHERTGFVSVLVRGENENRGKDGEESASTRERSSTSINLQESNWKDAWKSELLLEGRDVIMQSSGSRLRI